MLDSKQLGLIMTNRNEMETAFKERIKQNLFPGAVKAVEPWATFRWHKDRHGNCDTWKRHSSQALAIDFFGTLAQATPKSKNAILNHLAGLSHVDPGENWIVHLEWVDESNPLNENPEHPTQFDAVARSEKSVLFFECKFAESKFSGCSQVEPLKWGLHRGLPQCDGNFALQKNPDSGAESRCALTGKNILYWSVIPSVFGLRNDVDHHPCPFAGQSYQAMRNLVNGVKSAETMGLQPAFFAVFAEANGLAMARYFKGDEWSRYEGSVDQSVIKVRTLSYQTLCSIAQQCCDQREKEDWGALTEWITAKISQVS